MVCVLACLAVSGAAFAETVEESLDKLAAAELKIKSLSAKYKTMQDMEMGEGMKSKSDSEGTVAWTRKGDRKMIHTSMKSKGVQSFSGQETKFEQSSTTIMDGQYSYTVTEQDGQKSAMKMKVDGPVDDSPKAFFTDMKDDYELKLLPDETVDGAACCVVEATPKTPQDDPIAKQTFYFRRDSGLNVKMVGRDKANKVVFDHSVTDVQIDADIPADKFVFKAPEGVEVIDMTQPAVPPTGGNP
jgi:outer membrane lipoprotein-sorting protein